MNMPKAHLWQETCGARGGIQCSTNNWLQFASQRFHCYELRSIIHHDENINVSSHNVEITLLSVISMTAISYMTSSWLSDIWSLFWGRDALYFSRCSCAPICLWYVIRMGNGNHPTEGPGMTHQHRKQIRQTHTKMLTAAFLCNDMACRNNFRIFIYFFYI